MANIFLSVPILGKPELKMMYSMYQAILSCKDHRVRVYYNENDSLISRVRNVHCSVFLDEYPECSHFMSIDSDLEIVNCFPDNNIFTRLVGHDKDFVGGMYAIKNPKVRRSASIPMNVEKEISFDSGLHEMRWLSSGCWCVKRKVMQELADGYPELTYDGDDNAAGKKVYGVYIPLIYDMHPEDFSEVAKDTVFRKYLSEDWSFIQRWRDLNPEKNKVWCDSGIALRHIGKFAYTLWDVEVKSAPAQVGPNAETSSQSPKLPPPGFDLKDEMEKGNLHP